MKRVAWVAVVAVAALVCTAVVHAGGDKAKGDKEKIQGAWEVIEEDVNGGQSSTFDRTNPPVWVIAADKIEIKDRNSFLLQEGQAVFRWATTALHPVARKACELAGIDPTELAAFVPHQANLRIVEAIARRLGVPRERVADPSQARFVERQGLLDVGRDPALERCCYQ